MNRRDFFQKTGTAAAAVALSSVWQCKPSPKSKPNFVFILVDDLGWNDLGCFGSEFYETPNLDRLARQGMRFTDAYAACPVCSPTRASIMCGKYPARIHLTDWIPGRQASRGPEPSDKLIPPEFNLQMALEEITLAEALKQDGYKTGFVGKWHLGQDEKYWPEHQGFDVNKGGWRRGAPYYRKYNPETDEWTGESGYFSPYKNPRLEDGPPGEYLTDRLTHESISFIDQHKNDPFLLYLSFYTVHNPLHGKEALVERFKQKAIDMGLDEKDPFVTNQPWMLKVGTGLWRERVLQSNAEYAAMVYSMDENVGRVLQKLDELGLSDNTVVFFMADNGGLSTSEGSPTSNLPLRGGKGWLYDGGVRESMMIKWPGVTPPGSTCSEPVISTDFYPTMLEMAGLSLNPQQHMDGVSLVPLLKGQSLDRDAIYWHYPHYSNQGGKPGGAIRSGDYKLIEFYEDMTVELYNLRTDMSERHNLADQMPDKVTELREKLHAWRKTVDAHMMKPNPDYDENYGSRVVNAMNEPK
jgi:arylsulfatase A-like enzyme